MEYVDLQLARIHAGQLTFEIDKAAPITFPEVYELDSD
jgi:hypothetical protein